MTLYYNLCFLLMCLFHASLTAGETMFSGLEFPVSMKTIERLWPSNSVYESFSMQTTTMGTNQEETVYRRYVVDKQGNNPIRDRGISPTYAQPILQYHTMTDGVNKQEKLHAVEVYKDNNSNMFFSVCNQLSVVPIDYERACVVAPDQIWEGRQVNFVWLHSGGTNRSSLAVRFCYRDKELYSVMVKNNIRRKTEPWVIKCPAGSSVDVVDLSWFKVMRFNKVAQTIDNTNWVEQVSDPEKREKLWRLIHHHQNLFNKGEPIYAKMKALGAELERTIAFEYTWALPSYKTRIYKCPSQGVYFVNRNEESSLPYVMESTLKIIINFQQLKTDACVILPYNKGTIRKEVSKNHTLGLPDSEMKRLDGKYRYQIYKEEDIALLVKNNFVQYILYWGGMHDFDMLLITDFGMEIEDQEDIYYQ